METPKTNNRGWERLLHAIKERKVVPIIGSELFSIEYCGQNMSLNRCIIKKLSESIGIEYDDKLDFTQLAENYPEKWKSIDSDIYYQTDIILKELYEQLSRSEIKICGIDLIQRLLNIDIFDLVLTTSFDDLALMEMGKAWGEVNPIIKKCNGKNDIEIVKNERSNPILYYMFGQANQSLKNYVLTDDDFLMHLQSWFNEYRPSNLINALKNKYLLLIGCKYPYWLFRFIVHSMNNPLIEDEEIEKMKMKIGVITDSNPDDKIDYFLSSIEAFTRNNAETFFDELEERWDEYVSRDTKENEVFISYTRKDRDIADKIRQAFEDAKVKVFFDETDLIIGDKWENEIKKAIENCLAFVPIISDNILLGKGSYVFEEWKMGIDHFKSRFENNEKFLFPIIVGNINVYNSNLPDEMKEVNMKYYSEDDCFSGNIQEIIKCVRKQKRLIHIKSQKTY